MLSRIIVRRPIVINRNYHSGGRVNKADSSAAGGSILDGI